MSYEILLADDEVEMLDLLRSYLAKEGYIVHFAKDGYETMKKVKEENVDILVLDIMMPKMDGYAVCEEIRKTSNIPIIMLTAKGSEWEKVHGLKIGADDYIVKPFSPKELIARIEALLRRTHNFKETDSILTANEVQIDVERYIVTVDGAEINVTRKEFQLLTFFMKHKGQVFSREQLLDHVWGLDSIGTIRTVDTHIKTLRVKLGSAGKYIQTVWGVGYKFEV